VSAAPGIIAEIVDFVFQTKSNFYLMSATAHAWATRKSNVHCTMVITTTLSSNCCGVCEWLNEKRDIETSSRLIPFVDDLTHILIEAGKNKLW
jgi:hypothetical protein